MRDCEEIARYVYFDCERDHILLLEKLLRGHQQTKIDNSPTPLVQCETYRWSGQAGLEPGMAAARERFSISDVTCFHLSSTLIRLEGNGEQTTDRPGV